MERKGWLVYLGTVKSYRGNWNPELAALERLMDKAHRDIRAARCPDGFSFCFAVIGDKGPSLIEGV